MENQITFTRVKNDYYGNPRYVVHYLNFLTEKEMDYNHNVRYAIAKARANKLGGRVYRGKDYGGGFVFQSYNTNELEKQIKEIE